MVFIVFLFFALLFFLIEVIFFLLDFLGDFIVVFFVCVRSISSLLLLILLCVTWALLFVGFIGFPVLDLGAVFI